MKQGLQPVSLERRQHRVMDRGDRAGMAAGKSQQVLVRLLDRAEPFAQTRNRPLLEGNDLAHWADDTPRAVNFLLAVVTIQRLAALSRKLLASLTSVRVPSPAFVSSISSAL